MKQLLFLTVLGSLLIAVVGCGDNVEAADGPETIETADGKGMAPQSMEMQPTEAGRNPESRVGSALGD